MGPTCRLPQAVDAQSPQHFAPSRALDPRECANVAPEISGYRYPDGTAPPYPAGPPATMYLAGSYGRVRVSRSSPDGELVALLSLSAGEFFRLSAGNAAERLRSAALVSGECMVYGIFYQWVTYRLARCCK